METLKSASKSVKDAIDSSLENTATASQNAISAQLSPSTTKSPKAKDPGHPYAKTKHISFTFHDQTNSPAPFGYEYYVSLPPAYHSQLEKSWPLILFLHGAGESQRAANESYASLRHGVPKVILCYDKWKDGMKVPSIDIPLAPRLRRAGKNTDKSSEPVDPEVCRLVAEEFITVTPSLNMGKDSLLPPSSPECAAAAVCPGVIKPLFKHRLNSTPWKHRNLQRLRKESRS